MHFLKKIHQKQRHYAKKIYFYNKNSKKLNKYVEIVGLLWYNIFVYGEQMKVYGNLDLSKIKTIIFDFDETMYYSSTVREKYVEYIKKTILTLSSLDEKTADELMAKYGFTADGETRVSFGKNCEKFNVTKQQWDNYRIKNFFQIDYNNACTAPNELYQNLSKHFNLYIVSNEIYDNVLFKAKKLNIDLTPFKKVFAPTLKILNNYCTKSDVYKNIKQIEDCQFEEIMVVGDRYNVDIQPLEELGGKGLLVKHTDEICDFFVDYLTTQQNAL